MQLNLGLNLGCLNVLPRPVLDLLTVQSTASYSLRKLRTAYTGSALRVRRSQDNAELDIGFTSAGDLNTTALLDHVGYENLLAYSEDFSNAYWTKSATFTTGTALAPVVVDNDANAPNGTPTADKITFESTGDGQSRFFRNTAATITAGIQYTASVWIKAASPGDIGKIVLLRGVGVSAYLSVTLTESWQRIERVETSPSTTANFEIALRPLIGGSSGSVGVHLWGTQLNQGATANPYKQTTTTAWTSLNGFVTTWYDQSTNGYNAIQTTASNQPIIVSAGVVETENGRPTVVSNGNQWLVSGNAANWTRSTVSGMSNAVLFRRSGTTYGAAIGATATGGGFGYLEMASSLGGFRLNTRSTPTLLTGAEGSFSSLAVVNAIASPTTLNLRLNGTIGSSLTGPTMTPITPNSGLVLFDRIPLDNSGSNFVGAISEVILFKDTVLSTVDSQLLERKQGSYYLVTVS